MNKTTLLAALFATGTIMSGPVFAQTGGDVIPGNTTAADQEDAAERDAVADDAGTTSAPVANPDAATTIPGNDTEIENELADERDAVATDGAAATDAPSTSDGDGPVVPGSGATFSDEGATPLQEEAPTGN